MKTLNEKKTAFVYVNQDACDGCGVCVETCPTHVFEINELTKAEVKQLSFLNWLKVQVKGTTKSEVLNPDWCTSCGNCVTDCHAKAISITDLKFSA